MSSAVGANASAASPFMKMPRELRDEVYKLVLTSTLPIPATPTRVQVAPLHLQGLYATGNLYPDTRILQVSKTIYAEAWKYLYTENKFTTLGMHGFDHLDDILVASGKALRRQGIVNEDFVHNRWISELQTVTSGRLGYSLDEALIAIHACCHRRCGLIPDNIEAEYPRPEYLNLVDVGLGFNEEGQSFRDLVLFFWQIGTTKSSLIKDFEIVYDDEWSVIMDLNTTLIKHFMPRLQRVTLQLRDFGTMVKRLTLEEDYLTELFRDVASYLNAIPTLECLTIYGGYDELQNIGIAIIERGASHGSLTWSDIEVDWAPLKAKYLTKVNGIGSECVCRRIACHQMVPGDNGEWGCDSMIKSN